MKAKSRNRFTSYKMNPLYVYLRVWTHSQLINTSFAIHVQCSNGLLERNNKALYHVNNIVLFQASSRTWLFFVQLQHTMILQNSNDVDYVQFLYFLNVFSACRIISDASKKKEIQTFVTEKKQPN